MVGTLMCPKENFQLRNFKIFFVQGQLRYKLVEVPKQYRILYFMNYV